MLEVLLLIGLGLVAAAFGSIVGLGGGIIIVPGLMLLGPYLTGEPVGHATAVGTSLSVLIVTALASTISYAKANRVDFRSGWLLFITSGPGAMAGSALTGLFKGGAFQLVFGIFILIMAGLLITREYMKPVTKQWPIERTYTDPSGDAHVYGFALLPLLTVGFGVGLVSGLFGIGGGSLFVPVMVLLFRFPPHVAAATSMFVIFLSSILGSGVKAWAGDIDYSLALCLIPGAWFGGKLGAYIAGRVTGKTLLWVLRVTLIVLALQLIVEGSTIIGLNE
ncbi:sulfite exporter TauE/SafE family protein [Paenibacillus tarimensis]